MMRHAKVTLTLREEDARWLLEVMHVGATSYAGPEARRAASYITDEIKHALAECDCGEETR